MNATIEARNEMIEDTRKMFAWATDKIAKGMSVYFHLYGTILKFTPKSAKLEIAEDGHCMFYRSGRNGKKTWIPVASVQALKAS